MDLYTRKLKRMCAHDMKTLHQILYPDGLKKWFAVPTRFASGGREEAVRVHGVPVEITLSLDAFERPVMGFNAVIKYASKEGDEDYDSEKTTALVPLIKVDLNDYIAHLRPRIADETNRDALSGIWHSYINGRRVRSVFNVSMYGPSTKTIVIREVLRTRSIEPDKTVFADDADEVTFKFELSGYVLETMQNVSITRAAIKKHVAATLPDILGYHEFEHNGAKWTVLPTEIFNATYYDTISVAFEVPAQYWGQMERVYKHVFSVPSVETLVYGWMPLTLANQLNDVASRIIMAFYPTRFPRGDEPLVRMLGFDKKYQLVGRRAIDDTEMSASNFVWRAETNSKHILDYRDKETRLQELTQYHFVKLSDEEIAEMERLIKELKALRTTGSIQCQICFLNARAFQISSGRMAGLEICALCKNSGGMKQETKNETYK